MRAHHHPLLLPLNKTLLLFHQKAEELWSQTPTKSFVRTTTKGKDAGKQVLVTRRAARALTDGAKWTGQFVLEAYWKHVDRVLKTPLLFGVAMTDTGLVMPSLLLNARDLNQKRTMTERSMRNHLTQLKNIGIISGYKWHGSRQSFELWISPEYVLKTVQKRVEKHTQADSTAQALTSLLGHFGKEFPPIELPELQETLKDHNGNVLNPPSKKPLQGTEVNNQAPSGTQASKSDTGAARAPKMTPETCFPEDAVRAEILARKEVAVAAAWCAFKAQVYQEKDFTEQEELEAKRALWRGEYREFPDNLAAAALFQANMLRRITLVEEYFWRKKQRGAKAWATTPWAVMVPGTGYFDVENRLNGFIMTRAWLVEDRKRRRLEAANTAVARAVNELTLRHKLDKGTYSLVTKTGKARRISKQVLNNTKTQLFQLHQAYLQQQFGTDVVHKFLKRIQFKLT